MGALARSESLAMGSCTLCSNNRPFYELSCTKLDHKHPMTSRLEIFFLSHPFLSVFLAMALDGSGHEQRKDVSISCSAHFYLGFRALLPLIRYLYLGFFFIHACIKSRVLFTGVCGISASMITIIHLRSVLCLVHGAHMYCIYLKITIYLFKPMEIQQCLLPDN